MCVMLSYTLHYYTSLMMRFSGVMSQSGHIVCALLLTSITKEMIDKDILGHTKPDYGLMKEHRGIKYFNKLIIGIY